MTTILPFSRGECATILSPAGGERATILSLARGERATICGVDAAGCDPVTARRLHEMGFDDGVEVQLLHRGPLGGDPLAVRVGSMTVALRRHLAAMIGVETLGTDVSVAEAPAREAFAQAAE